MAQTTDPEKSTNVDVQDTRKSLTDVATGEVLDDISYDQEAENKALRKFDIYVFPVSVIFIVLATLDRNNVSIILPLPIRQHC